MAWTKVAKPTGTAYTNVNPVGKQTYDQYDLTYDSSITYYDSVNQSAWTKVAKPGNSSWKRVVKPSSLATGIISYYKLDGNSNDTITANVGTDTAITYSNANGIINQGAGFNGINSIITVPYINIGTTLSVSFWVKLNDLNEPKGCVSFMGMVPLLYPTTGQISYFPDGVTNFAIPYTFTTGKWYNIVITQTGTTIDAYINTSHVKSGTGAAISTANTSNAFGSYGGTYFLNGSMDEIGVWSRVLTPFEVITLYENGRGTQYPFTTS